MPAHCSLDMADVPLSVSRSMSTSSAGIWKGLKWARRRISSRWAGVVSLIGSTILILKGSMITLVDITSPSLYLGASPMTTANTAGVNRMFPIAIDFLRFSGRSQEFGDSRRRQRSLADAWSERTTVPIDIRVSEEGVSGFKDQERRLTDDAFALALFLKMIEAGTVQAGDYLLLENLDRLSRAKEVRATHLLTSILVTGVKIVQLAPYELEL